MSLAMSGNVESLLSKFGPPCSPLPNLRKSPTLETKFTPLVYTPLT